MWGEIDETEDDAPVVIGLRSIYLVVTWARGVRKGIKKKTARKLDSDLE